MSSEELPNQTPEAGSKPKPAAAQGRGFSCGSCVLIRSSRGSPRRWVSWDDSYSATWAEDVAGGETSGSPNSAIFADFLSDF